MTCEDGAEGFRLTQPDGEEMTLRVGLSAQGLAVILPSGRRIAISATAAGARFLEQMLQDAQAGRVKRGYIGSFPTQAIAEAWERAERSRMALDAQVREFAAAKPKAKSAALASIDASKIVINL